MAMRNEASVRVRVCAGRVLRGMTHGPWICPSSEKVPLGLMAAKVRMMTL